MRVPANFGVHSNYGNFKICPKIGQTFTADFFHYNVQRTVNPVIYSDPAQCTVICQIIVNHFKSTFTRGRQKHVRQNGNAFKGSDDSGTWWNRNFGGKVHRVWRLNLHQNTIRNKRKSHGHPKMGEEFSVFQSVGRKQCCRLESETENLFLETD